MTVCSHSEGHLLGRGPRNLSIPVRTRPARPVRDPWLMRFRGCAVYMLCSGNRAVLYTGVTNDIARRVHEHRERHDSSPFTARYRVNRLVHVEAFDDISTAIEREKQIKGWSRRKKDALIAQANPEWADLWPGLFA